MAVVQWRRMSFLSGFPFLLVGLVSAYQLTSQTGSPPAATSSTSGAVPLARSDPASGGIDGSAVPHNSPLRPFVDFLSVGEPDAGDEIGKRLAAESRSKNLLIDFLVATVPDPIDSRFAYQFDGLVDSIEEAVGSQRLEPRSILAAMESIRRATGPTT